ncbi:hypothetical protein BRADI_1g19725v3 [Brachypodium distachyon]|uniref:Uncharacterized protein n=1 Tax=Brachypodium distachyon TaxID=15368 RepID=A0A2K2DK53_BRADI|nr:hypothetical protein BRADI_1g19725v3 [Brachypodium distachyon]
MVSRRWTDRPDSGLSISVLALGDNSKSRGISMVLNQFYLQAYILSTESTNIPAINLNYEGHHAIKHRP